MVENDDKLKNQTQNLMDGYLDTKETFPKEIRDKIESEYRRMWKEKLKWLEDKKREEQL